MRSSFVSTTGLKLIRTPSVRQQAARRRLAVVGVLVGFAVVSGAVGFLTAPHGSAEPGPRTGPFSYFPSQ
jgi:hypothetical protein